MQSWFLCFSLVLAGCNADKIAQLESENQDLRSKLASQNLDLQAKCSAAAKADFAENWQSDQNTVALSYSNHYSNKLNGCFIEVLYNFAVGTGPVTLTLSVSDVYAGTSFVATYSEQERISVIPGKVLPPLIQCYADKASCKSREEFIALIKPYMEE